MSRCLKEIETNSLLDLDASYRQNELNKEKYLAAGNKKATHNVWLPDLI